MAKQRSTYSEKLRDPRWQKIRLQVFDRDSWACKHCGDSESTLHVHHHYYERGNEPWEYPLEALITLCEECHNEETFSRKGIEESLLYALRKRGFSAGDVSSVAIGFYMMELQHLPEVVSSAIGWALESPEMQAKILDAYFLWLDRHNKDEQ